MRDHQHCAARSVFVSIRATKIPSQSFSLPENSIFLAIGMDFMLTPPPRYRSRYANALRLESNWSENIGTYI